MSTDEEDDILHGYIVPVPSGPNLRVTYQPHFKSYRCPGRKPKWPLEQQVRNHVVNQAKSMAARLFNKKMVPPPQARQEPWMDVSARRAAPSRHPIAPSSSSHP
jgi:hypothetical protein